MLPRPRLWGACRAMAVRARPRQSATPPIAWSSPRAVRRYADDAGPKQPASAFSSQPDETSALSSANSAPGSAQQRSEPAVADAMENSQAEEDEADNGAELLRAAMAQDGVATPDGALTPEQELALYHEGRIPTLREAEEGLEEGEEAEFGEHGDGFKFAPPATPMPPNMHLKKRYHPVLDQLVRLLMRDGKLSAAQKHMSHVLNFLRTSPPPIVSERRPLLPGAPPPSHLPLNPVLYLTVAVDSVAPLIRVLRLRDAGGGGRSLEVPLPLSVRQRRRQAWLWIMDVVAAKPSMGSGRKQLAHRIADELIAIVEGRSSVWEKKATLQKMATAARVNVAELGRKRKKKMGGR